MEQKAAARQFYDFLGIGLSLLLLAGAVGLWMVGKRWDLEPKDVGDYIAGIVSAIALIWLVLGYRLQRTELVLQLDELRESTQAQKSQNLALVEQTQALKAVASALSSFARPYVTASVELDGFDVVLRVRNDGSRAAINIQITFDPDLTPLFLRDGGRDLSGALNPQFLRPSGEFVEGVGYAPSLLRKSPEETFAFEADVSVVYDDEVGNRYEHCYRVSIFQHGRNQAQKRSPRSSLHEVVDAIGDPHSSSNDSLSKSLKRIADSLGKLERK